MKLSTISKLAGIALLAAILASCASKVNTGDLIVEPFTCERDGLTIRGHVYRAPETALPAPAVILSHPFMANEAAGTTYAVELAKEGYITFTYDFCGGGPKSTSDGPTEDMTIFTEIADLNAVMDYVKSRPDVDGNHLTLMGQSQGGAVSALTAKSRADEVEKLVLFYPALSIPDDARAGNMIFIKFDPENIPDLIATFPMKLGGNYARCVLDFDMFAEITGYEGPVFLIHGTKDSIVDIKNSDKAQYCYPDCTYLRIEGADHGFKGKDDEFAINALKEFMAR